VVKLLIAIGLCLGTGAVGGLATAGSINTWYVNLSKPFFNPPNWIFGPVWTILYILMGIALYLVWINPPAKKNPHRAEMLFGVQLFLNILWSVIFFGLKNPLAAFLEIILLWAAILLTWQKFKEISKFAANLLVPYLAWVSFAAILNLAIVILN
jgi:tryptophan-rich sensory protein